MRVGGRSWGGGECDWCGLLLCSLLNCHMGSSRLFIMQGTPVAPGLRVCSRMVGHKAGQPEQLGHRLLQCDSAGQIILDPLQVQRTQFLVVTIRQRIKGADLFHRVDVVSVGKALFRYDNMVERAILAAPMR